MTFYSEPHKEDPHVIPNQRTETPYVGCFSKQIWKTFNLYRRVVNDCIRWSWRWGWRRTGWTRDAAESWICETWRWWSIHVVHDSVSSWILDSFADMFWINNHSKIRWLTAKPLIGYTYSETWGCTLWRSRNRNPIWSLVIPRFWVCPWVVNDW